MLTDGENNLFCNIVGKPVRKHMEPLITDEINKYMKEIDEKIKAEEKEERDGRGAEGFRLRRDRRKR